MNRRTTKPSITAMDVEMLRKESIVLEIERRKLPPTATPIGLSCEVFGISQRKFGRWRISVRRWREKILASNKSLASPGSNQEEAGSSPPTEVRLDATKDILSQSGSDTAERSAS